MKLFKQIMCFSAFTILFFSCSSNDNDTDSSGCEECVYTIPAGETAGSVPASLHGEFNLTLDFTTNGYSLPVGTQARFVVSATEMIVDIDGEECITLRNPTVSANQVEFTFRDNCRDNLAYSISSSSSGGLNEINVGDLNFTFLGQFKE